MSVERVSWTTPLSLQATSRAEPRTADVDNAPAERKAAAPPDAGDAIGAARERLESVTRILQDSQRSLSFSVDEATGKTIVQVVHAGTGEILRQIPSEELLAIAATFDSAGAPPTLGIEHWT